MHNFKEIPFGKHRRRTLPWVALHDPDWLFWAIDEDVLIDKMDEDEVIFVSHLAKNILIPDNLDNSKMVYYIIQKTTGKFETFEIIERKSLPSYSNDMTKSVIDLSVPHYLSSYDKLGNKLMLQTFKFHYFGSHKYRLTEMRCIDFFTNRKNFDLSCLME